MQAQLLSLYLVLLHSEYSDYCFTCYSVASTVTRSYLWPRFHPPPARFIEIFCTLSSYCTGYLERCQVTRQYASTNSLPEVLLCGQTIFLSVLGWGKRTGYSFIEILCNSECQQSVELSITILAHYFSFNYM